MTERLSFMVTRSTVRKAATVTMAVVFQRRLSCALRLMEKSGAVQPSGGRSLRELSRVGWGRRSSVRVKPSRWTRSRSGTRAAQRGAAAQGVCRVGLASHSAGAMGGRGGVAERRLATSARVSR